ncbi:MAG: hypothetical protein LW854_23560 [Rubrivivax sp.]|jgi:hypothetical protein|nr:hypothetical protein [Rubrivivax sp.]
MKTLQSASTFFRATRVSCAALAATVSLVACKTSPQAGPTSSAQQYISSCLTGALVGALIGTVIQKAAGKGGTTQERNADLAKAALGGCVVGVAATAIGRLMDERQQAKHEEAMQAEVRRRALEQQQFAMASQRAQTMPAATAQQRNARDAELERARAAYQASLNKPVQVDLGNGGTTVIQVQQPQPATPGTTTVAASPTGQGQCQTYSVLVRTPAGQARQFETWCPNASGQLARVDVRDAA